MPGTRCGQTFGPLIAAHDSLCMRAAPEAVLGAVPAADAQDPIYRAGSLTALSPSGSSQVTPEAVLDAMLAADAIGRKRLARA